MDTFHGLLARIPLDLSEFFRENYPIQTQFGIGTRMAKVIFNSIAHAYKCW